MPTRTLAVIRTLQADEHLRGCLMEERVLKGDLAHESWMARLTGTEQRFVLLAMHQTLADDCGAEARDRLIREAGSRNPWAASAANCE